MPYLTQNSVFLKNKIWIKEFFHLILHHETSRGGAVVARWAHNPKVAGSSPAPATKSRLTMRNTFS